MTIWHFSLSLAFDSWGKKNFVYLFYQRWRLPEVTIKLYIFERIQLPVESS